MSDDDLQKYADGKWHDLIKYQCPFCPFDSVNPELFRKHLAQHAQKPAPSSAHIPIVDRYGNTLNNPEPDPDLEPVAEDQEDLENG